MGIFSKKPKMDSRQKFFEIIRKEYSDLTLSKVEEDLLDAVSTGVTDYYYEQYQRFRKQYPKSIKRYSSFNLKDLDHPNTHELIIKIVKEKVGTEYENPTTKFLDMTLDELKGFEKNREEFYNMF
tara:strand:+ start:636 stop:1010 length:375 start_codon:yes stop_codon:yes gene_type:complete